MALPLADTRNSANFEGDTKLENGAGFGCSGAYWLNYTGEPDDSDKFDIVSSGAMKMVSAYQLAFPFLKERGTQDGMNGRSFTFSISIVAIANALVAVRLPAQGRKLFELVKKDGRPATKRVRHNSRDLATYTWTITPNSLRITNSQGGVLCEVELPLTAPARTIPEDGLAFTVIQEIAEFFFQMDKDLMAKARNEKLSKVDWLKTVGEFKYNPSEKRLYLDPKLRATAGIAAEPASLGVPLRKASELFGAKRIDKSVLMQAISHAGLFTKTDPKDQLVSTITIENGSARGASHSSISVYENKSLSGVEISLLRKQSTGVRSILRRSMGQIFMAKVDKMVVLGDDTLRCEFEQSSTAIPPVPEKIEEELQAASVYQFDPLSLKNLVALTLTTEEATHRDQVADFLFEENGSKFVAKFTTSSSQGVAEVCAKAHAIGNSSAEAHGIRGRIRVLDLVKIASLAEARPLTFYLSDRVGMAMSQGEDFVSRQVFMFPD